MTRSRLLFLGSKPMGMAVLRAVRETGAGEVVGVVTIDDRADPRSAFSRFVADVPGSLLHVLPRAVDLAPVIDRLRPDLVVVSGWYHRIDEAVLRAVPRGFVGLHGSCLPAYRGGSPIIWQILLGCPSVGLSLFQFGAGIDDGPIWAQTQVPVGPDDYIAEVLDRVQETAVQMVRDHLPRILLGNEQPMPQDPTAASYCGMRVPADGKISWQWSAEQIYTFVRAQSVPYPGAYAEMSGDRLIVWQARPAACACFGTPGQVIRVDGSEVMVACGVNTALWLQAVERADWSFCGSPAPKPATEALSSIKVRLG